MGYGPADKNRFGWCFRSEHGNGKRLTPYFETEELVNEFHNYASDNKSKLTDTTPKEIKESMYSFYMLNGVDTALLDIFDLRKTKLSEINKLTLEFINKKEINEKKVIINPIGETIKEFYGTLQQDNVGYEDPTLFEWETD